MPDSYDTYDSYWHSAENVCASAVVELGPDWALGILKVGIDELDVEHLSVSIRRIGPAGDPDEYWQANAGKVQWERYDGDYDKD